jgi:hypothetical protein
MILNIFFVAGSQFYLLNLIDGFRIKDTGLYFLSVGPQFLIFVFFAYFSCKKGLSFLSVLRDTFVIALISLFAAVAIFYLLNQEPQFLAFVFSGQVFFVDFVSMLLGFSLHRANLRLQSESELEYASVKIVSLHAFRVTFFLSFFVFLVDIFTFALKVGKLDDFLELAFVLFNPLPVGMADFALDIVVCFPLTIVYLFVYIFLVIFLVRRAKVAVRNGRRVIFHYLGIFALTALYLLQSFVFLIAINMGGD